MPDPTPTPQPVQNIPSQAYSGFWVRVGAYLIDGIILLIPLLLLFFAITFMTSTTEGLPLMDSFSVASDSLLFNVISIVVSFTYFIYFTKKNGATLGKKALKLKVISVDGKELTWKQVILRESIGRIASGFFNIGYIMVAFSPVKQGLHDRIAGTYVVSGSAVPIQQSVSPTPPLVVPTPPVVPTPSNGLT